MTDRILHIVETAYRATLEEQDDPVVWITHAMKAAGAQIDVCLRGNAVNYAVRGQDAAGLAFGAKKQTQPPRLANDVGKLITDGAHVFLVDEDLVERGIERTDLIAAVERVRRSGLPRLVAAYDRVWHW
jgi:sulfur relay (sulfurtransferase) DsrF/TusC family protein